MPSTRNRASAPTEVVHQEEEEEVQEPGVTLQFNEPLTWRAGKSIPVAELLRRLQSLSRELRDMEQEEAERESLLPAAKELASQNLLTHKDKGVRAWTACCVVDMFRLCAPDAPYTGPQLKDVFTLFVTTIFPSLSDPSSPYNSQHLYVLKSLAEVKTIVLLTDIPGANDLILRLFACCFDVLSGPSKAQSGEELSKNVEHHMTAVLATLIDEAQSLSSDVIDVVLAQFLRADPRATSAKSKGKGHEQQIDEKQSTLLVKEAPPAYNMAKNICNSCPEKMARYVSHYFSSVMIDASAATTVAPANGTSKHKSRRRGSDGANSDDEGAVVVSEEELHETRKAHRLLRELWRSSPSVLQDIIPQLEMELGVEEVEIRRLATETIGDMIAGIGAAGPPTPVAHNPAAYPSQSLVSPSDRTQIYNFLTTPNSPHSFPSRHTQTYMSFVSRKNDKSPIVRTVWTTAVGRVLMTSAGGVGLDSEEEQQLLKYFSDMLVDGDERVRLAAIKAIEQFTFDDIVQKLGSRGSVTEPGSLLANLTDRVKDKKSTIRFEAMQLLAKIWGVAFGAISEGSERTSNLLGAIPSKLIETIYINDLTTTVMVDRVLFESLLPLGYPSIKPKAATNGASQRVKDSQAHDEPDSEAAIDKIRAERELILIRDLETKAKTALFHRENQGIMFAKFWETFLKACEDYNGGVMEDNEADIKKRLSNAIEYAIRVLPDPARVSDDLWKFAKMHDRRNYQLIRFCYAPESDYRKVSKAIKELMKRVEEATSSTSTLKETLTPLVYRASLLLYNKSHVLSIIEYSRTDEKELGSTAHQILKMISTKKPQVFKAHVRQLCQSLEAEAPTAKKPNGPGAVDDLKACAGFARSFPDDVPKDRKFVQAMLNFALYGSPPNAAKYGVLILMSSTDKKEMYAKDILQQCTKGFKYGEGHWLAKLAALSQLVLVGSKYIEDDFDPVIDIAINEVLLRSQSTIEDGEQDEESAALVWQDEIDDDCAAKIWALKILVNRLRSLGQQSDVAETARPVYKLLTTLVAKDGEISKKTRTPPEHRARLKLTAAQLLLKLSTSKRFDDLLTPQNFNQLALVAQDPLISIRSGFVKKLQKYLGHDRLQRRYYTIIFLLSFEPVASLRESTITWLRSRAAMFAKMKDTAMEALLARFLSLLAHHPDFGTDVDELKDNVRYILFYLKTVATENNISLIYHVAQRVKGVKDGINEDTSEHLYCLSDLAQAVIQRWADAHDWSLQAYPSKLKMPSGIFKPLQNHDAAQDIAMKSYVPEELVDQLDDMVRAAIRTKKRKADSSIAKGDKKRTKTNGTTSAAPKASRKSLKVPKTPKPQRGPGKAGDSSEAPTSEIRRSSRAAGRKSYLEVDTDEEDAGVPDAAEEDKDVEMSDATSEKTLEAEKSPEKTPEPEVEEDEPAEQAGTSETEAPAEPAAKRGRGRPKKGTNGVKRAATPAKKATPAKNVKGRGKGRKSKAKEIYDISDDASSDSPGSDDDG